MEDKIIIKLNKYKTSIELFLAFSIFIGLAISGTLFKEFTFY